MLGTIDISPKHVVILDSDPTIYELSRNILSSPMILLDVILVDPDTENLKFFETLLKSCVDLIIINYHLQVEHYLPYKDRYHHEKTNVFKLVLQFHSMNIPVAIWTDYGYDSIRKEHKVFFQENDIDILDKPCEEEIKFHSWLFQKTEIFKSKMEVEETPFFPKWITLPV